jgi:hypothetical protein
MEAASSGVKYAHVPGRTCGGRLFVSGCQGSAPLYVVADALTANKAATEAVDISS